jgi:SAM-dependent methyltransferase
MNYIEYWNNRYKSGKTSGKGSYGKFAIFKADVINDFITKNKIIQLIDIGCGDGNNAFLLKIKKYIGLDISPEAIKKCVESYTNDRTKEFHIYNKNYNIKSDLIICLDVLYHITDDKDYYSTLNCIFKMSNKYVILYTSIDAYKTEPYTGSHVKHRNILEDLKLHKEFELQEIIPQKFINESSASFLILKRIK